MLRTVFVPLLLFPLISVPVVAQPVDQPFTFDLVEQTLPQVEHGFVAWGDVDADGDLDVAISGRTGTGIITDIFRNDGKTDGQVLFTPLVAGLPALLYSHGAWVDYDRDGDLDLMVMGSRTEDPPFDPVTALFENNSGQFSEVTAVSFEALHSGTISWGDYDNDGDDDVLLAGLNAVGDRRTLLYSNDGSDAFSLTSVKLKGGAFGDAQWGDYDNDGDLDLALTGDSQDVGLVAGIYRNNGNGTFAKISAPLLPVAFGSLAWGDYDNDGDLDLIQTGGQLTLDFFKPITRVLKNEGSGFVVADLGLPKMLSTAATWGDYDSDGDLDLLLSGAEAINGSITARLYRNDGAGVFEQSIFLIGTMFGASDWADFDGDGDLDLLASGQISALLPLTNLYENKRQVIPPNPEAPANLVAIVSGDEAHLQWTPPSDGLSYNLRVGTAPGRGDIVSALADPTTGHRLLFKPGNVFHNSSWTLKALHNGVYFWSVQSVDHALEASTFAAECTFTVTQAIETGTDTPELIPVSFALYPGYPNPFTRETTLSFDLPEAGHVVFDVYDVLGKQVASLIDEVMDAGTHTAKWNGRDNAGMVLGTGMYLYVVRADGNVRTGTITFVR